MKMKSTTVVIAAASLVILLLCFLVVDFDRKPEQEGLQEQPINNQLEFETGDSNNSWKAPAARAECEECEVEWWPPRFWTQNSKYSPAAESSHGLQMHGTLAAQREIWRPQNPSTCHDQKFLVYEALDVGHGIGSTIHVASVALLAALNLNRTLVLFPQSEYEWVQGKFCEGLGSLDECYFKPLSSCSVADAFGGNLVVSPENLLKFQDLNVATYNTNSDRVLRWGMRQHDSLPFLTHATPVRFHKMLQRGNLSTNFWVVAHYGRPPAFQVQTLVFKYKMYRGVHQVFLSYLLSYT